MVSPDFFSDLSDYKISLLCSQSQGETKNKDPSSFDPCFKSQEEMDKYLRDIGQKDSIISDESGQDKIIDKNYEYVFLVKIS